MLYVNGSLKRIRTIYGDVLSSVEWKAFNVLDLHAIRPSDTFLTIRAWDWIAKRFVGRLQDRRPLVVQLADGHLSELNCVRTEDRVSGTRLYRPLLCDLFVGIDKQAPNCFATYDQPRVRYVRPAFAKQAVSQPDVGARSGLWALACGRDPFFFDESQSIVRSTYIRLLREASERGKRIVCSIPNTDLWRSIFQITSDVPNQPFGEVLRLSPPPELVLTTPSTVALEATAAGMAVCVIKCWPQDINFPLDITWCPDDDLGTAMTRIGALDPRGLAGDLFGAGDLRDVLADIQRAHASLKVDLREQANRVKMHLAHKVGSLL